MIDRIQITQPSWRRVIVAMSSAGTAAVVCFLLTLSALTSAQLDIDDVIDSGAFRDDDKANVEVKSRQQNG